LRDPDHGYERTKAAIDTSLAKWGHGYIDLYLIHSPLPGAKKRLEAWKAIEDAIDAGKIKSGGVSNYGVHHLQELLKTKPRHLPAVNQVELHPFLQRKDIDDYCRKHGIYLEAYSPLTRGQRLKDPALVPIAKAHQKSVAQILIRYTLQKVFCSTEIVCADGDRDGLLCPSRSRKSELSVMHRSSTGTSRPMTCRDWILLNVMASQVQLIPSHAETHYF
jgi:diketogulonate reductase-like aldo/keto reductase